MDRRQALKQTAILLGAPLSATTLSSLLTGCQPNGAPDWEPQFFTKEQAKVISEIAECILPSTNNSPGAKALYVDEFIDLMLNDSFSEEEQQQFLAGLAALEDNAQTNFEKNFLQCNPDQQVALLQGLELEPDESAPGKAFFTTIKGLSLIGYFTSETIMTEQLNYAPVPGKWEGCIDITADTPLQVDNNV